MSTKSEKIESQAFALGRLGKKAHARHLVGPAELTAALEAREILKEMIPMAEWTSQFCADYAPCGSMVEGEMKDLIRRAKEVV